MEQSLATRRPVLAPSLSPYGVGDGRGVQSRGAGAAGLRRRQRLPGANIRHARTRTRTRTHRHRQHGRPPARPLWQDIPCRHRCVRQSCDRGQRLGSAAESASRPVPGVTRARLGLGSARSRVCVLPFAVFESLYAHARGHTRGRTHSAAKPGGPAADGPGPRRRMKGRLGNARPRA